MGSSGVLVAEFQWLRDNPHFEERPASIQEFLGPSYLNIEQHTRPALIEIFNDLFGPDPNPNRISLYQRAIFTGGVGVGKTTVASVVIPYMAHWVLCLKDPQGYFDLMPGSRIAFMQMSTSESQAKEVVFGDIKARIDNSPWFKSHYQYDKAFKNQFRFPKDVWIIPGDSAETTFEGYNILGGILDEADSHKITRNKDYAEIGYCVDEETEIFTRRGWVSYDRILRDDFTMTLNHDTGMSEWQPIQEVCVFPAQRRELVLMEGREFSALTTGHHRWPTTTRDRGRRWRTTDTLTSEDRLALSAPRADLPIEPKYSDALVEAVAWFWTEGHIHQRNVAIYQKPGVHADRIRGCLNVLFGPPVERFVPLLDPDADVKLCYACGTHKPVDEFHLNQRARDGRQSRCKVCLLSGSSSPGRPPAGPLWRESRNRQLLEFHLNVAASEILLSFAPGRVPETSWMNELTQAQLDLFIQVSMWADNCGPDKLAQKNPAAAEAFAHALILAGRGVSYRWIPDRMGRGYEMRLVRQLRKNCVNPKMAERSNGSFEIRRVLHDGIIWCPRTENQTWLARRNGSVYFTGNTTIHGRITSRFQDRGFLMVVGQMKKSSGFAAKMYRDMTQDPHAYTSLLTIWESLGWSKFTLPDGTRNSFWYDTQRYAFTTRALAELQGFPSHILEVPRVYERDFLNSPQKALRDLAGRPPAVNSPLFHDPSRIADTREVWAKMCGDIPPVGADNRFVKDLAARNSVKRVGHIDVAYSSEGDALGLAIAHVPHLIDVDGERKPFILFDLVMRIKAPPGRELHLADIRKIIYELKFDRNFNITKITTDGFQCVVGDTIIPTLDGQNRTIAELAQTHPKGGFWTYSYNHATGRIAPGRCTKAWKTGTKPVLEVLLDSGEIVKTTHDHRFMMRDGSYREARDLRSGDSLMPLYRDVTPDDWKGLQGYERIMQPGRKSGGRWQYTHRMVAPPLRNGEIVHHKDFGKRNNAPENLEVMTVHDHRVLHAKAIWEQPGHREKMSRIISESNRQRTGTEARRRRHDVTIEMLEPFRGGSWRVPAKELNVSQDLIYARVREAGWNGWNDFSYGEINGRCVSEPVTYRRRDRSNHKVVSVTDRGETEDVYDLSIAEHHNFAIGAGVFIHNSTDMRQQLQRKRIHTEILSADRSTLPYHDLHDAVAEGRVAIPPYMVATSPADPTLHDIVYVELSSLQDQGSKIDHPPDGSKDIADAIACTVSSIMGDPAFHRASSANTDWMGGGSDMNVGQPVRGDHPAFVGGTLRAPIPPRIGIEPIQWRPPTQRR